MRESDVRIIHVHKTNASRVCVMEVDDDDGPRRTVARDDALVKSRIRMSFNLCPICWMPLAMDSENPLCVIDKKWEDVGVTFKGKPAFSIKHPGQARSLARHVFAFGTMSIAPSRCNYQKCHFVHYSMVGNHDRLANYWKYHDHSQKGGIITRVAVDDDGLDTIKDRVMRSTPNTVPFEGDFDAFFSLVCVEKGIFENALSESSDMCNILNPPSAKLNYNKINQLVDRMKDFFIGCCDCNANMTISEYVQSVFVLIFFPSFYDGRLSLSLKKRLLNEFKQKMKIEHIIHYILLSGILYAGDLFSEDRVVKFHVRDPRRRATWQMRYVLVWCALQILMALWKYNSMDNLIAHHKNYIFLSVADFYFSLMLFALHEGLKLEKETDSGITFESFNLFYSSHMAFFRRHPLSNLSMLVLGINDMQQCGARYSRPLFDDTANATATVKRQLGEIMNGVARLWTTDFCKVSLLINQDPTEATVTRFFVPAPRVVQFNTCLRNAPLNVQTFADALHHTWYWYHFKYITMPSIAKLCKIYEHEIRPIRPGQQQDNRPYSSQGVRVWKQWYRLFDQNVRALGARADNGLSVRALLAVRG